MPMDDDRPSRSAPVIRLSAVLALAACSAARVPSASGRAMAAARPLEGERARVFDALNAPCIGGLWAGAHGHALREGLLVDATYRPTENDAPPAVQCSLSRPLDLSRVGTLQVDLSHQVLGGAIHVVLEITSRGREYRTTPRSFGVGRIRRIEFSVSEGDLLALDGTVPRGVDLTEVSRVALSFPRIGPRRQAEGTITVHRFAGFSGLPRRSIQSAAWRKAAVSFRKSLHGRPVAAYAYPGTLAEYEGRDALLADELSLLGITELLVWTSPDRLSTPAHRRRLRMLARALHQASVKVDLCILDSADVFWNPEAAARGVREALAFSASSEPDERIDGISLDIEPMFLDREHRSRSSLVWSAQGWGAGRQNDQLVMAALSLVERARAEAGAGLRLSEAISWSFASKLKQGQLSVGAPADFLRSVDFVLLMDYADLPTTIIRRAIPSLEGAPRNSVWIALKTIQNGVGPPSTTFWEEGLPALSEALDVIHASLSKYEALGGLAIFEFASFRQLFDEELP